MPPPSAARGRRQPAPGVGETIAEPAIGVKAGGRAGNGGGGDGGRSGAGKGGRAELRGALLDGQRGTEQEALHLDAVVGEEEIRLLRFLDALGGYLQVQGSRQ